MVSKKAMKVEKKKKLLPNLLFVHGPSVNFSKNILSLSFIDGIWMNNRKNRWRNLVMSQLLWKWFSAAALELHVAHTWNYDADTDFLKDYNLEKTKLQ